jgi:hypothetical protein
MVLARVILGLLCIVPSSAPAQELGPGPRDEEIAVFKALQDAGAIPDHGQRVFLRVAAGRPKSLTVSSGLPADAIESFLATVPSDPVPVLTLLPGLTLPLVDMIPAGDSAWAQLRRQHGSQVQVIAVTRAGFDTDVTHAVVRISQVCGGRCGGRMWRYSLTRRSTGWQVSDTASLVE